ncbi:MAG: hypothetical protein U0X87_12470 [Anaerolineales bacterium]
MSENIASLTSKEAGADFVKTSTGSAGGGATVHDVELMAKAVVQDGSRCRAESARLRTQSMIKAGATRIGASAGA